MLDVLRLARGLPLYLVQAAQYRAAHGAQLPARQLLRAYPQWRRTQQQETLSLAEPLPWLTFGAIAALDRMLTREARVFEYGAGGSTLFLCSRVAHVTAVEHDRAWHEQTLHALSQRSCSNVDLRWIEPARTGASGDPADAEAYVSSDARYAGLSWRRYAEAIDAFPDDHFDVVIVDGRARPSCARHALRKVRPGGYLVLDNAERAHYRPIHDDMRRVGWRRSDFHGPGPFIPDFWLSVFWQRPAATEP